MNVPPRVERALKLLGYDSFEKAAERMRTLGGRFVTMSVGAGSDLEPGPSWGSASYHTVTMEERDFALFALFASIGFESLAHPKIVIRKKLLEAGPPSLPPPNEHRAIFERIRAALLAEANGPEVTSEALRKLLFMASTNVGVDPEGNVIMLAKFTKGGRQIWIGPLLERHGIRWEEDPTDRDLIRIHP